MAGKRKKLIVLMLLIVGILAVGYKVKQWWRLSHKLKLQQQKLSTLQQTIDLRQRQLNKINYNLPENDRAQTEFLTELEEIINNLGLEVSNLTPRTNRRQNQTFEWPVKVKVSGKYQQLLTLFRQLKQLNWVIEVKAMQLAVSNNKLTANLNLILHTLAEGKQ